MQGKVSLAPVREAIVADVTGEVRKEELITPDPSIVADVAREVVGELVANLNAEQKKSLKRLHRKAVDNEWTQEELARRINDVVGLDDRSRNAVEAMRLRLVQDGVPRGVARKTAREYANRLRRERAETIARTEVANVLAIARRRTWLAARDEGLIPNYAVRIWRTHKDERTCKVCGPMNGQRAALDRPFRGGLMGVPAHPNCRCREELVWGQDVIGKSDPRDGDGDGFVDDGLPTMRPVNRVYNYDRFLGATWRDHAKQQEAIAHFDSLPGNAKIAVYHGTTKQHAESLIAGAKIGRGQERDRKHSSMNTEGLYVAPTWADAEMYTAPRSDDVVVKIWTTKDQLAPSQEAGGGSYTVGRALMNSSAGAVLVPGAKIDKIEMVSGDAVRKARNILDRRTHVVA